MREMDKVINPRIAVASIDLEYASIYAFYLIMPFVYAIQVILQRNDVALIPYLLLTIVMAKVLLNYFQRKPYSHGVKSHCLLDPILLYVAFMILLWTMFEAALYGAGSGLRKFMILFEPVLIYLWLSRNLNSKMGHQLLMLLSITSILVSAELLYEIYSITVLQQATWFQTMNYQYVSAAGFLEQTQLIGLAYRPPGLIEHSHSTATYIAVGFLASTLTYMRSRQKILLIISCINLITLFFSGARTVFFATLIVLAVINFVNIKIKAHTVSFLKYGLSLLLLLTGLILITMTSDIGDVIHEFINRFYVPFITTGRPFGEISVSSLISLYVSRLLYAWGEYPLAILFGFGPTTLLNNVGAGSDDIFIIQIFGQYGILGGTLFYTLWALGIKEWRAGLRWTYGNERTLLNFAGAVLILLLMTTLHSGVIQRKAIYPLIFLSLGIIRKYARGFIASISGAQYGEEEQVARAKILDVNALNIRGRGG